MDHIDKTELMEYWRMSNAYEVTRYKRLLWASSRYADVHNIKRVRVYKALDGMTRMM